MPERGLWLPEQHDQRCPARQGGACVEEDGCKAAIGSRLWLVSTPSGKHPKVIRAHSGAGALLSRVKDDEDLPKGGVWAVWALGNFPEQFEVDLDDVALRPGRTSERTRCS